MPFKLHEAIYQNHKVVQKQHSRSCHCRCRHQLHTFNRQTSKYKALSQLIQPRIQNIVLPEILQGINPQLLQKLGISIPNPSTDPTNDDCDEPPDLIST